MSNFDYLPLECIAEVLSRTGPRDVCRSSAVSRSFLAAADSDSAWEKFLPADNDRLRSTSPAPPPQLRKKDAYFDLCDNPLLLDEGFTSFSLERCSAKMCFMIGSRHLDVTWGGAPDYWIWSSRHPSRFAEVPELLRVCWLKIRCGINTRLLSPNTMYGAYLVFKFNEVNDGFDNLSVDLCLVFGPEVRYRAVFLDPDGQMREQYEHRQKHEVETNTDMGSGSGSGSCSPQEWQLPWKREDGEWMEIEVGEFFIGSDECGDVAVELLEVNRLNWKSGLVIEGFEFRPKHIPV